MPQKNLVPKPKPKLPKEIRDFLDSGEYDIYVEVNLRSQIDDEEARHRGMFLFAEIVFCPWDSEDTDRIIIGEILAWRPKIFEVNPVELWADYHD